MVKYKTLFNILSQIELAAELEDSNKVNELNQKFSEEYKSIFVGPFKNGSPQHYYDLSRNYFIYAIAEGMFPNPEDRKAMFLEGRNCMKKIPQKYKE